MTIGSTKALDEGTQEKIVSLKGLKNVYCDGIDGMSLIAMGQERIQITQR